ncbi:MULTISPECIES: TldD/PmbA family protein [unclassified Leptolyngbya]|uniref:TldD/PmbA family protein n=1 Tax=unclassified Leptolyngbya TaxID=2650499 RepID=UPI0016829416|nr:MULTISPECIES: TldD/PmbA family protein [unclassified Leptolyngbya]MBD1912880.1 TldD/PmbA family protein [Leptolyngbya sp. FACHB-8]MBD2154791.1 TldD/PmbA family protein [Leptolyngbya sp. FACHB-16]
MGSDYLDSSSRAEALLELALRSGAEAAEVYQSQSLSRPVFFEGNRLKQLEVSQAEGIALRLWRDNRPGLAVAYGPVEPQDLVDRAIALSTLNEPETIDLSAATPKVYPDVGETVPVEQLVAWGKEAIAYVRDRVPEILCSSEWECDIETTRLLNSEGLDCGYTDTTLSCYLEAELIRGDDFLNIADGQTERGSLDPIGLAEQIVQRLEWAHTNINPPSGRMPVLFTSKAADMLWGTIQAAMSGKQVIERASPWSEHLGEPVLSPLITITQDPDAGPFSCPFDDEGIPTQPITFIKEGVLQLFYTDHKIGRALGSGTTGNGFRPGLGSYPAPGLFNLLVQAGVQPLHNLIGNLKHGLIIDQMLGGGAGISGDFSINVDLGYYVRNGEILGRVKDTMVAGNVYTALKNVVDIGEDAVWNGACYTPSITVDGLSVIGRHDG